MNDMKKAGSKIIEETLRSKNATAIMGLIMLTMLGFMGGQLWVQYQDSQRDHENSLALQQIVKDNTSVLSELSTLIKASYQYGRIFPQQ